MTRTIFVRDPSDNEKKRGHIYLGGGGGGREEEGGFSTDAFMRIRIQKRQEIAKNR